MRNIYWFIQLVVIGFPQTTFGQLQNNSTSNQFKKENLNYDTLRNWNNSIGARSGVSQNFLLTNISNRTYEKYTPSYGFYLSVSYILKHQLSERSELGISANVEFIQKAYALIPSSNTTTITQYNTNDYLQIPVEVSYSYELHKVKFFITAGFYGAYWAGGYIKGSAPNFFNKGALSNYGETYSFNSKRDNRFEEGWQTGGGICYYIKKYNLSPFMQFDFYQSLTDQQKKYMLNQIPQYNKTNVLSIGVLININHGK